MGMTVALNLFISRSANRCQSFFKLLKRGATFSWDGECVLTFQYLKKYLASQLLLSNPELSST